MAFTESRNDYLSGIAVGQKRTSVFVGWSPYSYSTGNSEVSLSFSHGRRGTGWVSGGPWTMTRDITVFAPDHIDAATFTSGGSPLTIGGGRIEGPTSAVSIAPLFSTPTSGELDADGTTAIARTEPTNPAFDLSVFLGELRQEGLPNLPGSALREKTNIARKSGKEYLNVEFGWAPLVRGVRDFANTVNQHDKIIRSYQEGSGKVIQRRYQWPTEEASTAQACSHSMTPAVGFFTGGGRSSRSYRHKWFECEYRYYLPVSGTTNDKIRRYGSYARKLLGIELSPEVLWNLSPWSWAADWFANTGDVMHNISAMGHDGLVLRHGYMMCHVGRTVVDSGSFRGQYQVRTWTAESKLRRAATPYGFGVLYNGLSAKQKTIIAALGLSRW
jgi:hypothetical protein